jgi:hypothetical protein
VVEARTRRDVSSPHSQCIRSRPSILEGLFVGADSPLTECDCALLGLSWDAHKGGVQGGVSDAEILLEELEELRRAVDVAGRGSGGGCARLVLHRDWERAGDLYARRGILWERIQELSPPLCKITTRADGPTTIVFYRDPTEEEEAELREKYGEYVANRDLVPARKERKKLRHSRRRGKTREDGPFWTL